MEAALPADRERTNRVTPFLPTTPSGSIRHLATMSLSLWSPAFVTVARAWRGSPAETRWGLRDNETTSGLTPATET